MNFPCAALSAAVALTSVTAFAADYPAPRQGEWIAKDFKLHTGASRDYNPAPMLEKIEATLLLINAADDERNTPETGITDAALKRVKNGRLLLIPACNETSGHLTTGNAKFYKKQLEELLQTAPQKAM